LLLLLLLLLCMAKKPRVSRQTFPHQECLLSRICGSVLFLPCMNTCFHNYKGCFTFIMLTVLTIQN